MRSIELFAGAGGLGIGLSRAGFHPAAVVEIDRYCQDTIEENRSRGQADVALWPKVFGDDVRRFNYKPHEDQITLVSGGPPCQPFSVGGKHKAFADKRDMFPEAVRALRELRPAAFIFENVKGLTRSSFHNYFEYIKLQMKFPELEAKTDEDWMEHLRRLEQHDSSTKSNNLTYHVLSEVLNAANYGVPQKRERVFFVGFRSDVDAGWSFPTATHTQDALLWSQRAGGEYWERHSIKTGTKHLNPRAQSRLAKLCYAPDGAPWLTVRDALADLPPPRKRTNGCNQFSNHTFQSGARSYPGHTGSHEDEPAKTLKAGVHGVPGGENMKRDPKTGSVRYFSVRESARLQTFPDEFIFHGCWSETMRQLGNAVPVQLAEIVASSVREKLEAAGVK